MNAENFAQYLKNPSQLYQISYQELKSLVLQYPYCLNLHYLLLLKSQIDQHKDTNPNLEKTAAYSINRSFLYKKLKERELEVMETESFTINEDFLELKDLSVLDEPATNGQQEETTLEMEAPTPPIAPVIPLNGSSNLENPDVDESPFEEEDLAIDLPIGDQSTLDIVEEDPVVTTEEAIDAQIRKDLEAIRKAKEKREELIATETPSDEEEVAEESNIVVLHAPAQEKEVPKSDLALEITNDNTIKLKNKKKKAKKPSFTSWVEQFQSDLLSLQMGDIMEAKKRDDAKRIEKLKKKAAALKKTGKKKKKKKKKSKVLVIAQKSIRDNNEIASETLAKLLVAQEQYGKAIKVYERLLVQQPENQTFVEEIERINTLI